MRVRTADSTGSQRGRMLLVDTSKSENGRGSRAKVVVVLGNVILRCVEFYAMEYLFNDGKLCCILLNFLIN